MTWGGLGGGGVGGHAWVSFCINQRLNGVFLKLLCKSEEIVTCLI